MGGLGRGTVVRRLDDGHLAQAPLLCACPRGHDVVMRQLLAQVQAGGGADELPRGLVYERRERPEEADGLAQEVDLRIEDGTVEPQAWDALLHPEGARRDQAAQGAASQADPLGGPLATQLAVGIGHDVVPSPEHVVRVLQGPADPTVCAVGRGAVASQVGEEHGDAHLAEVIRGHLHLHGIEGAAHAMEKHHHGRVGILHGQPPSGQGGILDALVPPRRDALDEFEVVLLVELVHGKGQLVIEAVFSALVEVGLALRLPIASGPPLVGGHVGRGLLGAILASERLTPVAIDGSDLTPPNVDDGPGQHCPQDHETAQGAAGSQGELATHATRTLKGLILWPRLGLHGAKMLPQTAG
mmetsp:Transcript_133754/g.372882  ORF Transcript_133754/g.372882 Transcript_133754/m.372882 type:complete len:356 (-) Transcript_133754:36-1103(-)